MNRIFALVVLVLFGCSAQGSLNLETSGDAGLDGGSIGTLDPTNVGQLSQSLQETSALFEITVKVEAEEVSLSMPMSGVFDGERIQAHFDLARMESSGVDEEFDATVGDFDLQTIKTDGEVYLLPVTVELWLDNDQRLRRMRTDIGAGRPDEASGGTDLHVFDYDDPSISIEIPENPMDGEEFMRSTQS